MPKFYNDSPKISASDVNKFCHCPYQWYYERLYGQKELARLIKEQGKGRGATHERESNFSRGRRFHREHFQSLLFSRRLLAFFSAIILLAALYFLLKYLIDMQVISNVLSFFKSYIS